MTRPARLIARRITAGHTRQVDVLRQVSIELVADGSTVAIRAPSGSGKTTLLAVLGGLITPRAGTVAVEDGDGRTSAPDSAVAWVFQTTNALPRRSTLDNVALAPLTSGAPRAHAAAVARACLEEVGLAGRADQRAGTLSGGELQRVAVARALAAPVPFLLADEPTGQLDRRSSEVVATAMLTAVRAHRRGLALVTHDPELAARCDRELTLVDGELVTVR